jgi:hypothetical protein
MLGAIICAATIIFIGYMSVGVAGRLTASTHTVKVLEDSACIIVIVNCDRTRTNNHLTLASC